MRAQKKVITAAIAVVATSLSIVIGNTQPASAALSCQTGYNSNGWAWGKCTQPQPGGNNYRVVVLCQNKVTRSSYFKYGDMRSVYEQSPSTVNGCNSWLDQYVGNPSTQTVWN